MHTHAHDSSQTGISNWATAKPEKKNKNANGVARSDIFCPAALRVGDPKVQGTALEVIDYLSKPLDRRIFVGWE